MYKFVVVQGSCGAPYDINACEVQANRMLSEGYELAHVYQTSVKSCFGQASSSLVMVFKKN